MKSEWICSWQLIPGHREQTERFPTQEAARKAMAKLLREAVELEPYIQALRSEEGADCNSSADFLEQFLLDLTIPETEDEVPPHCQIPDHCLLDIHPYEGFRWEYGLDECPWLHVDHVYYGGINEPLVVSFCFDRPEKSREDRINAVRIQIDRRIDYGASAYPLMVLFALRKYPQTQQQIIRTVYEIWKTEIDRKTVGRHLQLLQELGIAVKHSQEGYWYDGESSAPNRDVKFSPRAYPLMVLQVLDSTPKSQAQIIRDLQERYGAKMDRKSVGRHLALLSAIGFELLDKCKDGYFLSSKGSKQYPVVHLDFMWYTKAD